MIPNRAGQIPINDVGLITLGVLDSCLTKMRDNTQKSFFFSEVYVISSRKGTWSILIYSSGFPAGGVAGDHRQGGGADHPGGDPADQGEEGQGGN